MSTTKPTASLPDKKTLTPGKSGVILHKPGCGGNHLGACNC